MHDTKERLSLLWIFVLLNYLYAACSRENCASIVKQA
jgi:hypothetical protein